MNKTGNYTELFIKIQPSYLKKHSGIILYILPLPSQA